MKCKNCGYEIEVKIEDELFDTIHLIYEKCKNYGMKVNSNFIALDVLDKIIRCCEKPYILWR